MTFEEAAGIIYGDHPASGITSAQIREDPKQSMGLSPEPCPSEDARRRIQADVSRLLGTIHQELFHAIGPVGFQTVVDSIRCAVNLAETLAATPDIEEDADGTAP